MLWFELVFLLLKSKQTQHKNQLHKPTLNLQRIVRSGINSFVYFLIGLISIRSSPSFLVQVPWGLFSGISFTLHTHGLQTHMLFSPYTYVFLQGLTSFITAKVGFSVSDAPKVDAVFLGVCVYVSARLCACVHRRGCFQVILVVNVFKKKETKLLRYS